MAEGKAKLRVRFPNARRIIARLRAELVRLKAVTRGRS